MRYCLVGPTYPYRGGISHYTTLLWEHLRQRNEVKLYSFASQYPSWLFPGRTDRDPSSLPLRAECEYLLAPLLPWSWARTARRIRSDRPQALILQWWVPFWAPSFASLAWLVRHGTEIKVIFICHHLLGHEKGLLDWMLARWTLAQGHGFVVHAQQDVEELSRLVPGRPVAYAPIPSLAAPDWKPLPSEEAKRRLGLPENVVLFFGFVRPYKGLDVLLRALSVVSQTVPIHLLVVGEFWDDIASYRALITELELEGQVTIVDRYVPNEDVALYFSAADAVILPYLSGAQSGIVSLAYSFARPIIASRLGHLAEEVRDGETGYLVAPGDVIELATAITTFFREGKADQFVEGVRAEQARHSWEEVERVIGELMGKCS